MRIATFISTVLLSFTAVLAFAGGDEPDGTTASPPALESRGMADAQAVYLVRSTLLALDAANRTGNYAVLHGLAAPDFQQRNRPEDLARIFADLPGRGIDLAAVALTPPRLLSPPLPDERRQLRLHGRFEPASGPVAFDLKFDVVDGHWRLVALAVGKG